MCRELFCFPILVEAGGKSQDRRSWRRRCRSFQRRPNNTLIYDIIIFILSLPLNPYPERPPSCWGPNVLRRFCDRNILNRTIGSYKSISPFQIPIHNNLVGRHVLLLLTVTMIVDINPQKQSPVPISTLQFEKVFPSLS